VTPIRFAHATSFSATLKQRVEETLTQRALPRHGGPRVVLKAASILATLAVSYVGLVFWATSLWQVVLCAFLVSQAIVLIGFNIMHDAGHGAFSRHGWLNRAMARSLDLIGGSIDVWRVKHHVLHHTYTNINAFDDDLDVGVWMRLHPSQPWRPWHRYQAFYAFPLYSLLSMHWVISDIFEFFSGSIGRQGNKVPTKGKTALFVAFKLNFFVLGLLVPMLFHGAWSVIVTFMAIQLVVGFTIALVFQLAHVVDIVDFPEVSGPRVETEWMIHQLQTTANFASGNRFVSWYCGGLNRQVEHHLFAAISHVHYKHLEPAVEQTCLEFNVPHRSYPTVFAAVRGHLSMLSQLARPAVETTAAQRNEPEAEAQTA
jgi:linoleoyl-CoA desaturase